VAYQRTSPSCLNCSDPELPTKGAPSTGRGPPRQGVQGVTSCLVPYITGLKVIVIIISIATAAHILTYPEKTDKNPEANARHYHELYIATRGLKLAFDERNHTTNRNLFGQKEVLATKNQKDPKKKCFCFKFRTPRS
jgi:hypothetical protein